MKAGQVKPVDTSAIEARMKTGLSAESQFARLLGVSVRTCKDGNRAANTPAVRQKLAGDCQDEP